MNCSTAVASKLNASGGISSGIGEGIGESVDVELGGSVEVEIGEFVAVGLGSLPGFVAHPTRLTDVPEPTRARTCRRDHSSGKQVGLWMLAIKAFWLISHFRIIPVPRTNHCFFLDSIGGVQHQDSLPFLGVLFLPQTPEFP